ncbi:hypothetical protein K461DRAFT_265594 [Myriangium duriaei CBS 260.36]|uniref:Prokaryotic-type class I peptide chain release factors domain-containing protein n=1 Tax=Myriangium duriaei CBS 260.36 TaxID=1168546 RepID=A0A9P4J9Z5_9PEZI|nr:hypothetical protein K461DRAFT_265594 [Myriangium duriaei CBS 260.36]
MYSPTTRLLLRIPSLPIRTFTTLPPLSAKPLPPLPVLKPSDYTESFLRGTGPGGQKINKTSSAVQLQHHPTGIVVKCQATRSRTTNRAMARRWLQEKIEEHELGDKSRTKMREEREGKKKQSAMKKKRRKYRALEEGKEDGKRQEGEDTVEDVVIEDDRVVEKDAARDERTQELQEEGKSKKGG